MCYIICKTTKKRVIIMVDYLKSKHILEERINIDGIPAILFRPKEEEGLLPTIIFYHGWSSNKEKQRLRGFILASLGYQVAIPDAIYHGEREPLSSYNVKNASKYFWQVIFNNMEEASTIIDKLVSEYDADANRIGLLVIPWEVLQQRGYLPIIPI